MSKKLVAVGEAAEMLGVSKSTLREWDREGTLVPVKTVGNHRRYKVSDIDRINGDTPKDLAAREGSRRVAVYCRVSSHEQKAKGDLERQSGRVLKHCIEQGYEVVEAFEEVGSGMNDHRPKLRRLFELVESGKIDKVIVEHKDRLCRFMFEFLVSYFGGYDVEIEWVSDILGKSYEEELVEDMLSLMSSFSSKIYGKRSAEIKKAKKLAEAAAVS
jgi:putative resolvase